MLVLFTIPAVLELLLLWTPLWRWRWHYAFSLSILVTITSLLTGFFEPSLGGYLLIFVNFFRIANYGRIMEGRLHETYLLYSARRTSFWLILDGLVCLLLIELTPSLGSVLISLAIAQLLFGLVSLASTIRRLRHTAPIKVSHVSDYQLPTLTVAIPARNESSDLEACLNSILASHYPKLEVLVLDDSSQRKTAEVIRQFAHDGVRFMPSDPIRPNWLPKNQAYQQLAQAASGDVILFCGVDVRFEPDSLRNLVEQMLAKHKQMLCIMPENYQHNGASEYSLIQPRRYAWELALPRRLFGRPPVLSSCWLINREALKNSGGFAAVTRMIVPEAYFARELIKHDAYRFMHSAAAARVISYKNGRSQLTTAIRTRYPQLHKRIEWVILVSLAEFGLAVLPPVLLAWSIWQSQSMWLLTVLTAAVITQYVSYGLVVRQSFGQLAVGTTLSLPLAALVDIGLLNYSMWKYEYSKLLWKGRDVTPTVMHTTPHLPKPSV